MTGKYSFVTATFILFLSLAGGCSRQVTVSYIPDDQRATHETMRVQEESTVKALDQHFQKWKGTKYRLGGTSRSGIDCSGFTVVTYRDLFGIKLPRTTDEQAEKGEKISKKYLQAGDLVFFKSGLWQRHVGIYLERENFMHVSTSKGVMVSNLHDTYWQGRFWQARRYGGSL